MQTIKKALGAFWITALIVACFSMIVSADTDVTDSGSFDGEYEYYLHSDGLLELKLYKSEISLENLSKECLQKATSLSVDFSQTTTKNCGISCQKYGANLDYCNIKTFEFKCSDNRDVYLISLNGFSKFTGEENTVVLPSNCKIWTLYVESSNITSLDYLKGLKLNGFYISDCNLLESVTMTGSYTYTEISDCDKLTKVDLRGCTQMTEAVVSGNKELTEVYFPDSLNKIVYKGCSHNPKITEVKIPSSVKEIREYGFAGTPLKSVYIPEGVTEIWFSAFSGDGYLETAYIPSTLTKIDATAFVGCSLKTVNFGGTKEQFEKITVSEYVPSGTTKTIYDVFGDAQINFNMKPKAGWVQEGNDWMYYDDSGAKVTGWKSIDGSWYLFDDNGIMLKDWQKSGNVWYYFGTNGVMKTGWQSVGKAWYYFGSDGSMRTNWQNIGGKWYYFGSDGSMKTGWQGIGGVWYYFESSGAMVTGWKQIGGTWYYFKSGGEMASREYCSGYWLDESGAWTYKYVAKWNKDGTGWWYGDSSGWYAANTSIKIDGKVYNFNASGYCTNP